MDSTYWFFFLALVFLAGCFQTRDYSSHYDPYGGQDVVYVDLPFAAGYQSQCVQGVGGEYSHMLECTLYDIDMDTPNDRDDLVFAPASGTVYVHSESLTSGFGLHINLDLGDGTYIILGHLDYVFVSSGQQVTAGEILAFEGTTGYSTGDHVHMGRHLGDASLGGGSGTSVMGLGLHVRDTSGIQQEDLLTYEMWCDLAWGHRYESQLQVAMWHPDGALLTTPYDGNIYRKERGALRRFYSEDHMLMSGQDYDDVILISGEEFSCYSIGTQLKDEFVGARIDQDDNVWLLYENRTDGVRERRMVPQQAWSEILQSWGFGLDYIAKLDSEGASLSTFDMVDEYAVFRDGTLLTEVGKSDVYFVSGKVAMPIVDWDTYLLMGLWNHEIIQVQPGVVESVFMRVGDCTTGKWCITRSNVLDCGYDFADLYTELDDSQDDKEDSDDNDSGGDDEDDQDTDVPVDDST
ncbi:M23 family metallopeptidase, partial [Patescibacteria group bacterium]|nr:M23 family metallopeptidase [Patescibacteria group bacterium]